MDKQRMVDQLDKSFEMDRIQHMVGQYYDVMMPWHANQARRSGFITTKQAEEHPERWHRFDAATVFVSWRDYHEARAGGPAARCLDVEVLVDFNDGVTLTANGVAKCNPKEEFDLKFGVRVGLDRALAKLSKHTGWDKEDRKLFWDTWRKEHPAL